MLTEDRPRIKKRRRKGRAPDTSVRFNVLRRAAKAGRLAFVERNMNRSHLTPRHVSWAIEHGLTNDVDQNVRRFAAMIISRSNADIPIEGKNLEIVRQSTRHDPVVVVRCRLGIALWRRGHINDEIVKTAIGRALAHPETRAEAQKCLGS